VCRQAGVAIVSVVAPELIVSSPNLASGAADSNQSDLAAAQWGRVR
jgi:hypothetical protein